MGDFLDFMYKPTSIAGWFFFNKTLTGNDGFLWRADVAFVKIINMS